MKPNHNKEFYRWALGYLRPYRRQLTILLIISVVEIVSGLLLPWPMKFLVDHALGNTAALELAAGELNLYSLAKRREEHKEGAPIFEE